jgi:hypothetical protein
MKLTHKFAVMSPDKRSQDRHMNGSGHGGEYPDTMLQPIKLTDAEGRSCICVPITQEGKAVDSQGYMFDPEDE